VLTLISLIWFKICTFGNGIIVRRSKTWTWSALGKKRRANIDREAGNRHEFLMKDYFVEDCVYTEEQFARRYRMPKSLVLKIMEIVKKNNSYFEQRPDCTGKMGLSTEQKVSASLRLLAYGVAADAVDEYFRLAPSTALKTLKEFCKTIVECPE
jgi:hypothetical protein